MCMCLCTTVEPRVKVLVVVSVTGWRRDRHGATRCSSSSPASDTRSALATSGGFPTSATRVVVVGRVLSLYMSSFILLRHSFLSLFPLSSVSFFLLSVHLWKGVAPSFLSKI